jgi:hypothetical protein
LAQVGAKIITEALNNMDAYQQLLHLVIEEQIVIAKNEYIIREIENPSEELQLLAIKHNYNSLKYIKNPTFKVIKFAIGYISNIYDYKELVNSLSEEQIIELITDHPFVFNVVKNPTEAMQLKVADRKEFGSKLSSKESQKVFANKYPNDYNIPYFPQEAIEIALAKNGSLINYSSVSKTEHNALIALNTYGPAIKFIKNPTEEQKKLAVSLAPEIISTLENPSEELQELAIGKSLRLLDCSKINEKIKSNVIRKNLNNDNFKEISFNSRTKYQYQIIKILPHIIDKISLFIRSNKKD